MKTVAILKQQTLVTAIAVAAAIVSGSIGYAQSAPFAGLAGVWSGSGNVTLDDGSSERIRCRASYAVSSDGNGLNQSLTCASDGYKFDLRGNLVAKDGALSGSFSEASRGVNGTLSGKGGNGRFNLTASAPGFTASVSLTTQGSKQSVSINSQGGFKAAAISLTRS